MLLTIALALSLAAPQASAQFREWNQPIEPFRIAGPLYYVGPANITSLLVATPSGHVLVDGGLEETAPIVIENIRKLGFRVEDVRVILSTHAHTDHAGGLARLKAVTGAKLYAGAADVDLLARGGRGDFAFADTLPFPPVKADVAVEDGREITFGGLVIRAISTPGHTKGCTTWSFAVKDGETTRRVVMIGGTTAPGYTLVGNTSYPSIATDFEATFRKLRALPADIVLEGHGFAFDLEAKRTGRKPFVDTAAMKETADRAEAAFRKQLQEQQGASRPPSS
jgi:metallo-beta-lactamase class B